MAQLMKLQKESTRQIYLLCANLLYFKALMVSTLTSSESQNLSKKKKLGPRTKITGNFLTEQDVRDNGDRVFEENKEWTSGSMTFVYLVRENQENVVECIP